MEEEKESGFFSQIKNQIITGVGVVLTGLGTMFMDEVKSIVGIQDEEPTEQVQPTQSQNTSVNVSGPEIIINIPEQKKDTVVKKVYVEPKPKPKQKEDVDW